MLISAKFRSLPKVLLTAAFVLLTLLFCTRAEALTLKVSCGKLTCKSPVTFTMTSDGTDQCLYAMSGISRWYDDTNEWVLVVDPSLGSYKTTFSTNSMVTVPLRTSGRYNAKFYVMDKGTSPITTASVWVCFTIDEAGSPTAEAIADSVAARCLRTCGTEFERALWLHDWLVSSSDYDYSYSFCSADAALTGNRGTCESYHRAYEMLLKRVGLETRRVTGNGHVWTAVKIDGKWCQVDVTWDDMGSAYSGTFWEHLYFGLTDELMQTAHDEHTPDVSCPCDSLDNNYFIRTGKASRWTDELYAKMGCTPGTAGTAALQEYMVPSTKKILCPVIEEALRRDTLHGVRAAVYNAETDSFTCCFATDNCMPSRTETVGAEAFKGSGLTALEVPWGTVSIGSCAFADSALQWIAIPDSVTAIADDAFEGVNGPVVLCEEESAAYAFAQARGFTVITE